MLAIASYTYKITIYHRLYDLCIYTGVSNEEGYMYVAIPLDARYFLISLSVPYQLKLGVECPVLGT